MKCVYDNLRVLTMVRSLRALALIRHQRCWTMLNETRRRLSCNIEIFTVNAFFLANYELAFLISLSHEPRVTNHPVKPPMELQISKPPNPRSVYNRVCV
jgi:hypothetical protein